MVRTVADQFDGPIPVDAVANRAELAKGDEVIDLARTNLWH